MMHMQTTSSLLLRFEVEENTFWKSRVTAMILGSTTSILNPRFKSVLESRQFVDNNAVTLFSVQEWIHSRLKTFIRNQNSRAMLGSIWQQRRVEYLESLLRQEWP
ncbi:hypothetical protein X975_03714, partial [Stegodyphus mimosarum]